jgi:hypothetical protein
MGILRAVINFTLFCVPGLIAASISFNLARRSKEEWALLAWVPALPLLGFGVYLGAIQVRDPTAANLWPFAMVALIVLTAILFGVFALARRLLSH